MKRRMATSGMTLLELMVVMAILVLIAGLMPLALDRAIPARRLSSTAEALVKQVRIAQLESARSHQPVDLVFAPDEDEHALSLTLFVQGQPPRSTTLMSEGSLAATDESGRPTDRLRLYPDGSTSGARVEIANDVYRTTVSISSLTGRIRRIRAQMNDAS